MGISIKALYLTQHWLGLLKMSIVSLKHYKDIKRSQIKDIKNKNNRIIVHNDDKLL